MTQLELYKDQVSSYVGGEMEEDTSSRASKGYAYGTGDESFPRLWGWGGGLGTVLCSLALLSVTTESDYYIA